MISEEQIGEWIKALKELPEKLRESVENLSYECLDWPYRPDGWTVKQVVHHLADSHMNSFIRFKLILTEDAPTVRPYNQDRWAVQADADNPEIGTSLSILEGVHARLTTLLEQLDGEELARKFFHPEYEGELHLQWLIGLYAWHSEHHLAHIEQALDKKGDFTWME